MILDFLGICATAVICLVCPDKKKEHILRKIEKHYVFTDSTDIPVNSCAIGVFSDKKAANKTIYSVNINE